MRIGKFTTKFQTALADAQSLAIAQDIAGVAAAVIGSLQTLISLLLGTAVGQSYDGTVLPLVGGFAPLGAATVAVMRWAERGR